jgi:hypothetical protein
VLLSVFEECCDTSIHHKCFRSRSFRCSCWFIVYFFLRSYKNTVVVFQHPVLTKLSCMGSYLLFFSNDAILVLNGRLPGGLKTVTRGPIIRGMIWSSRWFQSGIKRSTADASLSSFHESIRSKVLTMVSSALLDMTACAVSPRYMLSCVIIADLD